jgi:hypothetical protein
MVDANLSCTGQLNYGFKLPTQISEYSKPAQASIDDITMATANGQTLLSPVNRSISLPVSYTGKANRRYAEKST